MNRPLFLWFRSDLAAMVISFATLLTPACSWAQGWPSVDCHLLLQGGYPKPVWGSNEKLGQDALLMMINYQLAISLCQQDELLKIQRGPKNSSKISEPPKPPAKDVATVAPNSTPNALPPVSAPIAPASAAASANVP